MVTFADYNRKGNQENLEIRALNDAVLEANGGAWDNPVNVLTWTEAQARQRDRIVAQFEALGAARWGFKDPRTVVTLPFWRDRIPTLKLIGTVRHPVLVAKSLAASNAPGLPTARGLLLWEQYNRRILDEWHRAPFSIIRFDQPKELYLASVSRMLEENLREKQDLSFFEPDLVHEFSNDADDLLIPERARKVWDALQAIAGRGHPVGSLADLR